MPADGPTFRNIYDTKRSDERKEANKAPAGIIDSVEAIIQKYRGNATAVKAALQNLIIGSVGAAAALSCIPFEMNFGSVFAGSVLRDLLSPGVSCAIGAPTRDYLESVFPTLELNVRLLVTGIENGALTDEEIVDTAVDAGYKDKEIHKLLKIAKMARFIKETRDDYAMLDRYQDALISAQITNGRDEIDAAIKERQTLIAEWKKIAEQQAMEAQAK